MDNYRRSGGNARLRGGGDMSPGGGDKAGIMLAKAAMYTGVMFGTATLIAAVGFLLRVFIE
ncbi:hypothetical protein [Vreelandella lionensis]|uniref:hypothetical protein n=1 Tax=Vreelandella lionensis TaxID=1144478 RepID=UPI0009F59003|nr:hypothetical protein [Halomonas lionensis]